MRRNERGFTLIELAVAISIIAIIACAVSAVTFRLFADTKRSSSHMTALRQVHNAGYWISRDAQTSESMVTTNLEPPNFLILSWTEQDYGGGDLTYYSVTYLFQDLSNGVGKLKRNRWSSAGESLETMVADNIYYNPGDPDNTSMANYESPVLTLKLTAVAGDVKEKREYRIQRRPNL